MVAKINRRRKMGREKIGDRSCRAVGVAACLVEWARIYIYNLTAESGGLNGRRRWCSTVAVVTGSWRYITFLMREREVASTEYQE
jgi:hypothetical protein